MLLVRVVSDFTLDRPNFILFRNADPYVYPGSHDSNPSLQAFAKGLGNKRHTFHTFSGAWRSSTNPSEFDLEVERHDSLLTISTLVDARACAPQASLDYT